MKNTILLFIIACSALYAQSEGKYGISLSGFVKTDIISDSRQTVSLRENHFLLYPSPELFDTEGEDINSQPSFNMLSIQTRLTGKISGPDAFGAKSSALVEGAFFGHSEGDVNGFRLRHAYLKLDWENTSLLVGQYWHPLFITEVFPLVVSFNTGVPFQPFSRNPQIRLSQKLGGLEASFVLASQRDFASSGPAGTGSVYLRNSLLPITSLILKYKAGPVLLGTAGEIKRLVPQLVTSKKLKTTEAVSSFAVTGFAKFDFGQSALRLHGLYGSNMTDLLMIGGYAVAGLDTVTGIQTYTASKIVSVWGDFSYGKEFSIGLFAGYTKNLGTEKEIKGTFYGRGSNIDNVLRISPRIEYNSGTVRFSAETEYTVAAYGTPDKNGKVENADKINNIRLLLAAYYFF